MAALIARGKDEADVIAAVNFAREHMLTLAVRGGGHSGPGLGTAMTACGPPLGHEGIRVDPSALTARVEGSHLHLRRGGPCHASLRAGHPFIVT